MKDLLFKTLILCVTVMIWSPLNGQTYYSRSVKISFYSEAPLEKIEAHNYSGSSLLDLDEGQIEFAVLIKGFQFQKALMQQHFNESYMESHKYPKAIFKGSFDPDQVKEMSAENSIEVSGDLTIRGITKQVDVKGKLSPKGGRLKGTASFQVDIADFGIKVPKVVRDNIADTVLITVDVPYEVYEPK